MITEPSPDQASPLRREGFPGQLLIVLPVPLQAQSASNPLLRDLFVTASGHFPKAPGHYVNRREGIEDAVLIRVLRGSGWVNTQGRQQAGPGHMVLIPPGLPHIYGADTDDPWTIEWIHFRGTAVGSFIKLFGASETGKVLRGDFSGGNFPPFAPIYETLERGYTPINLLRAAVRLRTILTELHATLLSGPSGGAETRVRKSMDWMLANPGSRTTLAALAKSAGLSVPHFCSVFRRLADYSPIQYQRRLSIHRACQLLDTTELRIGEIASGLGWEDPLYFSRYFRRITGKSPRDWRDAQKG